MASWKSSLAIAVTLTVVTLLIVVGANVSMPRSSDAKDFSLQSIDGANVTLSQLRGKVVLLDFMAINCEGCKFITENLLDIYPSYDTDDVRIISIDIYPIESEAMLKEFRDGTNPTYRLGDPIPWMIARDTDSVQLKYSVEAIPVVVVIDRNGVVTWVWRSSPGFDPTAQKNDMQSALSAAISDKGIPTEIASASVLSLAILAAFGSFFSPCSFPLLPGYMAYYLGVDAESKQKPSSLAAAGRGFLAGMGMISVYGIIWGIVISIGASTATFVPFLGLAVGIILIILGILTLTPLQYHKLVEPFRKLRQRLFPSKNEGENKSHIGVKMYAYGVGYGAAGFACVAPPFIGAVALGIAFGILYGVLVLVVYSVIVVVLMMAITMILTEVGQAAVKKMNRYVNVIKKVSGMALIIAGAYLIYYWYTSQ